MNLGRQFLVLVLLPLLLSVSLGANAIPITLTTSSGDFGGLLLESANSPNVGVVLMHGRGHTPDSVVVRHLRHSLNNSGYTTLSIENPIPTVDVNGNTVFTDFADYKADVQSGANTVFPEMHERVQASLDYFETLGIEQVVIGGFSLGSRFATEYVARGQRAGDLPIAGLIGVGMYGNSIDPFNVSLTLDELVVPVLDIYGDADVKSASTANDRRLAYGGDAADYTQVMLDCPVGALASDCHKLRGNNLKGADDRPLETTVRDWMQKVAPISVPEPATWMLMLMGLLGMSLHGRKRA